MQVCLWLHSALVGLNPFRLIGVTMNRCVNIRANLPHSFYICDPMLTVHKLTKTSTTHYYVAERVVQIQK